MTIQKHSKVQVKTFLGSFHSPEEVGSSENYWQLIGEKGRVIEMHETNDKKVLVLFERDLDELALENHNPIKNSLWMNVSDLIMFP